MNTKVFALFLTLLYLAECQMPSQEMPQRVAQFVQRSQEPTSQVREISPESVAQEEETQPQNGERTNNQLQTATPQPIIVVHPQVQPHVQPQRPVFVQQTPPKQPNVIITSQIAPLQTVPVQTIPVQTVPVKTIPVQTVPVQTIHQNGPQIIEISQPVPSQPLPASTMVSHTDRPCEFMGRTGKCKTIPNFYSCLREGGIVAPDLPRCSWYQGCCIKDFF